MLRANDLHWFPMRIRNSSLRRLELMQERLQKCEDIAETYVPLNFIKVNMRKMGFAPFLLNYIFVRSTLTKLVRTKRNLEYFEPLRFVTHPAYDNSFNRHEEVLFITDKKMNDYMRITAEENEKVIFLNNMDYVCKPSQAVQVTEGEFAGIIGRIKRIKGSRCVVLPVGHEMAAAIFDVPNKFLRYLTEAEVRKFEETENQMK